MQSDDFGRKIRQTWKFLYEELGIARALSTLVSLKVSEDFNKVALAPESSYRDIYLAAVRLSHYNIILEDYSVFQFSWTNNESWRLAYLPNPWIAGVEQAAKLISEWELLESLGAIDDEEVSGLISELPYLGSVPAIRFEYAVRQYRELAHPAAHLHIGRHTENRWPVARVLNPLTFSMAIAKMYYSERWMALSNFYGRGSVQNCIDLRLIAELRNSRLVHDFSRNERRSLHFGSQ